MSYQKLAPSFLVALSVASATIVYCAGLITAPAADAVQDGKIVVVSGPVRSLTPLTQAAGSTAPAITLTAFKIGAVDPNTDEAASTDWQADALEEALADNKRRRDPYRIEDTELVLGSDTGRAVD